jgi:FkbM family methyltransferase
MSWSFDISGRLRRLGKNAHSGVSTARTLLNRKEIDGLHIAGRTVSSVSSVGEFYEAYFGSPERKCVIQVGANDGVMCDPLRRFLAPSRNQDIQAVLIEPIPFYFDKLRTLYADYQNISVLNAACGAATGCATLYFVDPDVADRMNGSGPANNWAHGQGSFDKAVIEYWIRRNRFRGEAYVKNVAFYCSSIMSMEVNVIRLADIELSQSHENLLVVIDVQGFELSVLQGIDWKYPPAYIVIEDDLSNSGPIDTYLGSRGYRYLCGSNDKVYKLLRAPSR